MTFNIITILFFYKSYRLSEETFVKYLITAPASYVKLSFGTSRFIKRVGCFLTSILSISMEDDNILRIVLKTLQFDKSEGIAGNYLDGDADDPCSIQKKTVYFVCGNCCIFFSSTRFR